MISLRLIHHAQQMAITKRLLDFQKVPAKEYFWELVFCLLTPQSKAERCFAAVEELQQLSSLSQKKVAFILRKYTRFHNNKASYVLLAQQQWPAIALLLENSDRKCVRDTLASSVKGLGLKEAGHFLRNIGKSNNQIAILDRHILHSMYTHKIISQPLLKTTKDYFLFEKRYLLWAQHIGIAPDELDLVLWSLATGKIFK